MKIREVEVKSIIVKTGLPEGDFVINPYIGCMHGCKFCYARFMKRFTGHTELWGDFVDVKINAPDLVPKDTDKYKGKWITIGSVTDPYQALERKYRITRQILEKLIPLKPKLDIMTRSDLVLRDIDLLKKFEHCIVALSLSTLDEKMRKQLEPLAPSVDRRVETLKKLHEDGIKTALFISPIFPKLTNWRELINKTKNFVDEYWFENLNVYPSIKENVYGFLRKNNPKLLDEYKKIYAKNSDYWGKEGKVIERFCQENKLDCRIYFHHNQ